MYRRIPAVLGSLALAAGVWTACATSPAQAAEQVTCGKYSGSFGYSRATDGSGFLSGPVEQDGMYSCAAGYGPAEIRAYCAEQILDKVTPGADRCEDPNR